MGDLLLSLFLRLMALIAISYHGRREEKGPG